MASLIGWLANAGARKGDGTPAASGYAWFYQPGSTSTQVTVFSDADGLYAKTQPVRLDAGGRAEVWTTAPVQLVIQDSTGATVRTQDRANTVAAAEVEIQNAVATGTSLTTGAQVAGGRTDLNTFLTNLATSYGAADGYVRFNGANYLLKDAFAALSLTGFYNVKGTPYSAAGDDSIDDTTKIQAAVDAAVAAGGGTVYFPPGTYRLTDAINISSSNVRFLGAGAQTSILKIYGTSKHALDFETGGAVFSAEGIGFTEDSSGSTCSLVYCNAAPTAARFVDCAFTKVQTVALGSGLTLDGTVHLIGCVLTHVSGCSSPMLTSLGNAGASIVMIGGRINYPGTAAVGFLTVASGSTIALVGTAVSYSRASASDYFTPFPAGDVLFVGCQFLNTSGGTLYINGTGTHTTTVTETGCSFGTNVSLRDFPAASTKREHTSLRTSTSATSYTPDALTTMYHEVVSTGATFAWNSPTLPTVASGVVQLFLRYKNTSGGNVTPTFGSAYKASSVLIASGSAAGWAFMFDTTLACWVQFGAPVAYAS